MRLFLDTEFNGFGGELISMALVPDMGQSWYEVCEFGGEVNPWVKEHVLPILAKPPKPLAVVKSLFHLFILQFENPEIVCDWHTDAQHFCSLLDGQDYGSSLDFACSIRIIKTPSGGIPAFGNFSPHNALSDALALRKWFSDGN